MNLYQSLRSVYPGLLLISLLTITCGRAEKKAETETTAQQDLQQKIDRASNLVLKDERNPPAPGFNLKGSDPKALRVVDSLVKYHGGRSTYDATRFFKFNFFGMRDIHWDKELKRARIDDPQNNTVYLLDYSQDTLAGRVRIKGNEVTDAVALQEALKKANSIRINDTYWLVHQFKMLDDGVTLKARKDVVTDPFANRPSYVIDQTFEAVGDTPGNRYRLYIDKRTHRINTWEFYRNAEDEEPAMQTPWTGYAPHRGLLLSSNRGGRFQLQDVSVPAKIKDSLFEEF